MRKTDPGRDIRILLGMVVTLGLPAVMTLASIQARPEDALKDPNASRFGYTISLLLFLFPILVLFGLHLQAHKPNVHRRALIWSSVAIASIGFVLDTVFGYTFFTFKNPYATLGIYLPSWDWAAMSWVSGYLPVEEFAFYILGALFTIAVYLWANDEWLADYDPDVHRDLCRAVPKLIHVSWGSLWIWLALLAAGIVFKRVGPHPEGFPGYFIFVMTLGFLPTFLFLRAISPFVNWRAFGFAFGILLLVSLIWEATLGVPYDWWNYHHDQMLGIKVRAWADLPMEAVLLWLVIAWDCIIAFELFRVYFHMDRPVRAALIGPRRTSP